MAAVTIFCKDLNKLDPKIRNLPSASRFKKLLLIYFKTDEILVFNVHNPEAATQRCS